MGESEILIRRLKPRGLVSALARAALWAGAILFTSCGDEPDRQTLGPTPPEESPQPAPEEPPAPPPAVSSTVAANPNNVISAVVSVESEGARSVRIEFAAAGVDSGVTPDFPGSGSTVRVPVLGLFPATDYQLRAVITAPDGATVAGPWMPFGTGELPSSIARFEAVTYDTPEPGFTLLSPVRAGPAEANPHPAVVVNSLGRVVWYRETASLVVDFQMQPNGHYTAAVTIPSRTPYYAGIYEEWDVLGNTVHAWSAQGRPYTDNHEIRLIQDGQEALLLAFTSRRLDLRSVGGPADAEVVGNVLQRLTRAGGVAFEWNSFDHYDVADADPFWWTTPFPEGYDFTHANAIELDTDGDYLLSTRHLSEITKIDSETGEIVWRMGKGSANQFTFLNDPRDGFTSMHSVRRLENGNLLLVDNGNFHLPQRSRAVEYAVDERAKTATLVWSYDPGVFSCCMGFAQRLPGGNTLVNLGEDPRVVEVSPSGRIVWALNLPSGGVGFFGIYRASRIPSLYGPG